MHSKVFSSFIVFAMAATAVLADSGVDLSANPWKAPGPNDLRSPCPGLNTLANHGFLPRDGRNISVPMIVQAGLKGYNMQSDILIGASKVGLLTSREAQTMSLEDIALHGNIEHDASLSRGDWFFGDNLHFNETIFTTLANANPGSDVYNTTSAGQVMHARLADSLERNPNITNTDLQLQIRSVESAFYLSVMGDVIRGEAPKKFVQVFFREERLPIEEGWKRSSVPITVDTLVVVADKIAEASDWEPTGRNCAEIVLAPPKDGN